MRRMAKHIKEWNKWRKSNTNGRFYKFLVLIKIAKSPTFEMIKGDEIYGKMWRAAFFDGQQ